MSPSVARPWATSGSAPRAGPTRTGTAPSIRTRSRPGTAWPTSPAASRRWRSTPVSIACRPTRRSHPGAATVPPGFLFAWKASRYITHNKKLKDAADSLDYLFERTKGLGDKLGPILFQLPPNLHRDDARLEAFLDLLPARHRYSIEFRHPGWYADEVLAMLKARNIALCISDHHHAPAPWEATADFIYLRGHGPGGRYHGRYGEAALRDWAAHIRRWGKDRDVFVYFDNDIKSAAPRDAEQLIGLLGEA